VTHIETLEVQPHSRPMVTWIPNGLVILRDVAIQSFGSPVHITYVQIQNKLIARWDTRDPIVDRASVHVFLESTGYEPAQARVTFEYDELPSP
jgi:hypothetical protein